MGITYADPDRDSDEHTIQIAALTPADNAVIIGNGTAWTAEGGGTLRSSLGLAIGVDVQAYTVNLDAWAGASPSDYLTTVAAAAAYQPLAARLTEIVATGITTAMFATNVVDNDSSLAANSSTRLVTQAAAKAYMDDRIAAQDAMVFKGVIDCSANPNYPAADRGWTYKVSVAGKIGGGSGPNVEVGDLLLCITDSTASGNHATVGANWNISQNNVDGAVTGPASSTAGNVPTFNGTSGKVLQDSGFTINQSLATTNSPTFAGLTVAGSAVMTRAAVETAAGKKTFSGGIAITGDGGAGAGTISTAANYGLVITSGQASPAIAQFALLNSTQSTLLMHLQSNVLYVNSDPVMTRGATETVTGVKTHSTHINQTAGAINLSGSGAINTDNALHLFFNTNAGKIQALENGVAWRNLDVDGATITLNGVNTSGSVAVGSGMVIGAPTGGNKGVGTLNATAVYDDNTLLTDLVLDLFVDGRFDTRAYRAHPVAKIINPWWFDLDRYAASWKRRRALPGMIQWRDEDEKPSHGEVVTRLTAVAETQAVHIHKLHQRLRSLEKKLAA